MQRHGPPELTFRKVHTASMTHVTAFLKRSLVIATVSLCLLAFGFHVAGQDSRASRGCKVGVQAPAYGFWTWAPNSEVKIYILAADFRESEIPYLLAPLQTWNAVAAATTAGVKFVYEGPVSAPRHCINCLTIMRGQVFDKTHRHATELQAYSAHQDQIMTFASIVIDPVITNLDALSNAVAHELGHNFGLLDCYFLQGSHHGDEQVQGDQRAQWRVWTERLRRCADQACL